MKEHRVLDCNSKEVAIIRAYADSWGRETNAMEALSFRGEGLPASADEYLLRKIEATHTALLSRFEYLVGLIWEVNQRLKREEER